MKYSSQIKPIDYLQTHIGEITRQLAEQKEPLLITENGEAKFIMQDIESYEKTQQSIALLKILALGNHQIETAKTVTAKNAIKRLREKKNEI